MKRFQSVSVSLTLVACLGMVLPPGALGANPVAKRQVAQGLNVALQDGGQLIGQVVTPQGKAKAGVVVSLKSQGAELARTKTDGQGRFAVKGLRGGSYRLATSTGEIVVNAWAKSTAPPKSAFGALLVDGTTVRGQCNCNGSIHPSHAVGSGASFNQGGNTAFAQGYAAQGYTHNAAIEHPPVAEGTPVEPTAADHGTAVQGGAVEGTIVDGGHVQDGSVGYIPDASSGCYHQDGGYAGSYAGGGAASGGGLLGFGLLGGRAGVLANPWVIGGAVAAAIAIPLAVDDDDDDDAS